MNLSRELILGIERSKQQLGKAGLPVNLTPESRDGSPHQPAGEWVCASSEVAARDNGIYPPKPSTAPPAGKGRCVW